MKKVYSALYGEVTWIPGVAHLFLIVTLCVLAVWAIVAAELGNLDLHLRLVRWLLLVGVLQFGNWMGMYPAFEAYRVRGFNTLLYQIDPARCRRAGNVRMIVSGCVMAVTFVAMGILKFRHPDSYWIAFLVQLPLFASVVVCLSALLMKKASEAVLREAPVAG